MGAGLTVGDESYFELTEYGDLVLFDHCWSNCLDKHNYKLSVTSAVLLDDGSIVLLNGQKDIA